jgi:hypothetical protein
MKGALQLTDAQRNAVYDLNFQSVRDMQALKNGNKKSNKEQFKIIQGKKDEKLKAILSANQFARYQQMKAERMKKMKEHSDNRKDIKQG